MGTPEWAIPSLQALLDSGIRNQRSFYSARQASWTQAGTD